MVIFHLVQSGSTREGGVLLRRAISLKVNFQTVIFAKRSVTMNQSTYKLYKNIFNGDLTKGKGEITTA